MLPFRNPTKVEIPDHPVFHDFKQMRYHVETVICYPHGGGGNFLARAVANGGRTDLNQTNEYNFLGVWLGLDHLPLDRFNDDDSLLRHLDELYLIAKNSNASLDGMRIPVARTHNPPFLTQAIHGFTFNQAAFIEVADQHRWFTLCLSLIKNHVNRQWESQPHMIELVLNHCIEAGIRDRLMIADYNAMAAEIGPLFSGIGMPWHNTLLSWDYLIHCKKNRESYSIDSLGIFLRDWLFKPTAYSTYKSDYYLRTRDDLVGKVSLHQVIDYEDLFMKRQIPERGLLSIVDQTLLANYSFRNLEDAEGIIRLLPEPEKSFSLRMIECWKKSLC